MKRTLGILTLLALAGICTGGCALPWGGDISIDTDTIAGCMAECMSDTLWVEMDGQEIPVVPSDYKKIIFK